MVYGDVFPMTYLEQIYTGLIMLIAKLYMAFMFSEVSNLMSSFYSANIEHIAKTREIVRLLKTRNCSDFIISRVERYRDFLWRKFKGIDDQSLISQMPETIRHQTQYYILENLVKKTEVIPKDEQGAILSIVKALHIKLYPQDEFIIKEGEIATEMFFLIEGTLDIYTNDGTRIARLQEGQCFGEMALLSADAQLRTANVFAVTDVSVAALSKDDFAKICEIFPTFKQKIVDVTNKRKNVNVKRTSIIQNPMRKRSSTQNFQKTILNELAMDKMVIARLESEKWKRIILWIFLVLRFASVLYNALFIPLQMAFRFEFSAGIYVAESLVLILHGYDIYAAVKKYRKELTQIIDEADEDIVKKSKKLFERKVNIAFECITFIPFCMILQNVYYPTYLIAFIKLIRLLKVGPLRRFYTHITKKWVNAGRLLQIVTYFYLLAHLVHCLLILMMYVPPTYNESWVKRVPNPNTEMNGWREGNDLGDASVGEIYIHFMYFCGVNLIE